MLDLAFQPAEPEAQELSGMDLEFRAGGSEEEACLLGAATLQETEHQAEAGAELETTLARRVEESEPLAHPLDRGLQVMLRGIGLSFIDECPAEEMELPMPPVNGNGFVGKPVGLREPLLVAAEGGPGFEEIAGLQRIPRTLVQQSFGPGERIVGTPEIRTVPQRLAQADPGARPQVLDESGAVTDRLQPVGDLGREPGLLLSSKSVGLGNLAAGLDQPFTKRPAVERALRESLRFPLPHRDLVEERNEQRQTGPLLGHGLRPLL